MNGYDLLGQAWRIDIRDHGGPHFQNGKNRYDIVTLQPIEHKKRTPPRLNAKDIEELRKSGLLDEARRKFPRSIVEEAAEQMGEQLQRSGMKCVSKRAARELSKQILRRIPVVAIGFGFADYAEGGVNKVVRNAVIPADLIEEVAEQGKKNYENWIEEKAENFRADIWRQAGLDPEDFE